jgi:hypothetical protein
MKLVSYEKALPTDLDCLSLIRKGLIGHVLLALALAFGYGKKKDICRLKMIISACFEAFFIHEFLDLRIDLQNSRSFP